MRFEKWAGHAPAWRAVLKPVSVLLCVASLVACGGGDDDAKLQAPPTQGRVETTNRLLDIAIVGDGMFALFDASRNEAVYSRYGKFDLDHEDRLVHASGAWVVGRAAGAEASQAPAPLPAIPRTVAPTATSRVSHQTNLDTRRPVAGDGPFDPTDLATFEWVHSLSIYDAHGNALPLALYFQHAGPAGAWRVYVTVSGVLVGDPAGVTLDFTPYGVLAGDSGVFRLDVPALPMFTGGFSEPLAGLVIDLAFTTASATGFGLRFNEPAGGPGGGLIQLLPSQSGDVGPVSDLSTAQDGWPGGALTGVLVSSTGIVTLRYDNGRSVELGQMLLARFSIIDRLGALANQAWTCRQQCSLPSLEVPATQLLGALQAGALESPI